METIEAVGYDENGEGESYDRGVVSVWKSFVGSVFEATLRWFVVRVRYRYERASERNRVLELVHADHSPASSHVHEQSSRRKS